MYIMSTKHLSDFTRALPWADTDWVSSSWLAARWLVMSAALCVGCPREPSPDRENEAATRAAASTPAPTTAPNQPLAVLGTDAGWSDAGADDGWMAPPPIPSRSPEFVEAQFLDTYRLFVPRDFTSQQKDIRWSRYYQGRWVRWTGQLRFVTADAFLFHHLGPTSSYEVSVLIPEPERARLRQILQLGRFYNYVGRLLRYETTFRVIVLEQGSVLAPSDVGVPGTLATLPWTHDPPPLPGLLPPTAK